MILIRLFLLSTILLRLSASRLIQPVESLHRYPIRFGKKRQNTHRRIDGRTRWNSAPIRRSNIQRSSVGQKQHRNQNQISRPFFEFICNHNYTHSLGRTHAHELSGVPGRDWTENYTTGRSMGEEQEMVIIFIRFTLPARQPQYRQQVARASAIVKWSNFVLLQRTTDTLQLAHVGLLVLRDCYRSKSN